MSIHIMQVTSCEQKGLDRRNLLGRCIKEDAFIFTLLEYGDIYLANMLLVM
jgi:hypothetical protein